MLEIARICCRIERRVQRFNERIKNSILQCVWKQFVRSSSPADIEKDVDGCASFRCCNCSSPAAETGDATAASDTSRQGRFICAVNGVQQLLMRRCRPPARTSTSGDAGVRMSRAQARRSRAERKFLRS